MAQYYRFARYADDIADNPKLSMKDKLLQLGEMEDVLYERIDYKGRKLAFIKTLRRDFIGENLSFSLLTDLLTAFRQDARNYKYETWGQLVEYCRWSAAPVGRFMLALHDENPSTYLPGTALCVALQIQNHLQDLKYDAKLLKRVYIPADMLKEYGVKVRDLSNDRETPQLSQLKKPFCKSARFNQRGGNSAFDRKKPAAPDGAGRYPFLNRYYGKKVRERRCFGKGNKVFEI